MRPAAGFTLIELMIVVAIIAILAALAIPAYQDYVIRSQVSEGLALSDGARASIEEYYFNNAVFPTNPTSAGIDSATSIQGSFVSQVDVGATAGGPGLIKVTYSSTAPHRSNIAINGSFLVLSPITASVGAISWNCSNAGTTLDNKYRPSFCR